jgi:hypothetical protein
MEIKTAFTEDAKERVISFFKQNMKLEIADIEACIDEALCRASEINHYELSGFESKSGNPVIIDFTDSDFEYEEINL